MQPIVLYDIPSAQPPHVQALSANTWKTRLALNYKGLPLTTQWVELPDIEALYHKLGLEASIKYPDGRPYYSLPLIYDPATNTHVSDSYQIALYLDKTYPNTPPLFPKGTLAFHKIFQATADKVVLALLPVFISTFCERLNSRSQEYYRLAREKWFGATLESFCNETQWEKAEKAWEELATILDANGKGQNLLMMGDQMCFADFQIAAMLIGSRNALGEDSEMWKRVCGWQDGKWKWFIDQFSKYATIDA